MEDVFMAYENTKPFYISNLSICRGSWNQPPEDTEGWLHSETHFTKYYCRHLCKMLSPWLVSPPFSSYLFDSYLAFHGKPFLPGWSFCLDALIPLSSSMCHLSWLQCHIYWCIYLINACLSSSWGEGRNILRWENEGRFQPLSTIFTRSCSWMSNDLMALWTGKKGLHPVQLRAQGALCSARTPG